MPKHGCLEHKFDRSGNMNDRFVGTLATTPTYGVPAPIRSTIRASRSAVSVDLSNSRATGPGTQTLTSIENISRHRRGRYDHRQCQRQTLSRPEQGTTNVTDGAGKRYFIDGLGDDRYDGRYRHRRSQLRKPPRAPLPSTTPRKRGWVATATPMSSRLSARISPTPQRRQERRYLRRRCRQRLVPRLRGIGPFFTGGAGNDTFFWSEKDVVSAKIARRRNDHGLLRCRSTGST